MQNLDSNKTRSISRTLSFGLIGTLVLVAGLSLGVNFILSSREAKAELEARVEEYTSALTDALKVPLWAFSEELADISTELSQDIAKRIRDAAEMGDITTLYSIAEEIKGQSDSCKLLSKKIVQMAEDFDLDGIQKLADDLVSSSN